MKLRIATGLAATTIAIVLTGCAGTSGGSTTDQPGYGGTSPSSSSSAPASSGAALMTADSDEYGQIVVDGKGMTVYMFDQDTQNSGTSSCEGMCLSNWPPVTAESDAPKVEGVTGEVGTITATDGSTQVTLNGWPLYYYAGDNAAGDTNGQGVNEVWWVLDPSGERQAE